jgi:hypothetical protein
LKNLRLSLSEYAWGLFRIGRRFDALRHIRCDFNFNIEFPQFVMWQDPTQIAIPASSFIERPSK